MKKILSTILTVGFVLWFTSAIYLSVMFIVNYFIKVDLTVSKNILTSTFILAVGAITVQNIERRKVKLDDTEESNGLKIGGCKTCKKK